MGGYQASLTGATSPSETGPEGVASGRSWFHSAFRGETWRSGLNVLHTARQHECTQTLQSCSEGGAPSGLVTAFKTGCISPRCAFEDVGGTRRRISQRQGDYPVFRDRLSRAWRHECKTLMSFECQREHERYFPVGRAPKLAERVGFEPTYRLLTDNTISSRARYGHFATSPFRACI